MKGEENQGEHVHQDQENVQHGLRVFPESSLELPNQASRGVSSIIMSSLHLVAASCAPTSAVQ